MFQTRSGLMPATITNLSSGRVVPAMFNPQELAIERGIQWDAGEAKGKNVPKVKFRQGGAKSLKLQLLFDTLSEGTDVRHHTDGLWEMTNTTDAKMNAKTNKSEPPRVEFRWGKFDFRAVITHISQRFVLFAKDGTPLRSKVDISFQQVDDETAFARQNPTSGGGPPLKVHTVCLGDRLDTLAAQFYQDPTLWRMIALANDLENPQQLISGQQLIIPAQF